MRHFTFQIMAWTNEVTLFTTGKFQLSSELRKQFLAAGVSVQDSPVRRLHGRDRKLRSVELTDGTQVPCDALFAHPPQRQVPLVESLGLTQDESGYLKTDPLTGETSWPGIYAAGDLTSRVRGAILAAAAATRIAAILNAELTLQLATSGT